MRYFLILLVISSNFILTTLNAFFPVTYPVAPTQQSEQQVVTINKAERYSDWQKYEFFFKIKLSNNQEFDIIVIEDDLIHNVYYPDRVLQLVEETFVVEEPGQSLFVYATLDRSHQFQGVSASIASEWTPDFTHRLVEVVSVEYDGYGNNYVITFSDNAVTEIDGQLYPRLDPGERGPFNVGDRFLRVTEDTFVEYSTGKVNNIKSLKNSPKFIKITW